VSRGGCVLAIDLGKTWCRAALLPLADRQGLPGGAAVPAPSSGAVAQVPGAIGLIEEGGVRGAMQAVEAALAALAEPRSDVARAAVTAVGMGAAGATAAPAAAQALAAALAARTGAPSAVTSDAVTSHVGALAGSPGVVLAAGTGAVAVAVGAGEQAGEPGRVELVDGWGQWLGDEGSGAWIGQQGLRAALRAHDGRGTATALRERAVEDFGALDQLPATLAAGGLVRTTAAFAPRVLDAARDGDGVALHLVRAAAARLGETTVAAVRRCRLTGPTPVALVGGLSSAGAPLVDLWWEAVVAAEHSVERVVPLGDSLSGAGLLALRTDLPHETAVVRSSRPADRSAPARHLEVL
jgi:N-acetylglucosamine kinase-like BadF-type ATPase